ncbi:TonB-dependent receptor plug domain-containing protein [Pseudothauera nasutitermitis]|uniref:TonB-dependent receptor plug domain-containing protein n=1 Tax=Pseudothauera nasutitermitis TaxID=2565930 RepID=UPI001454CB9C|nr:TonB-dependent receptor plug domain-containing protein [Pseudothauera nasutitermitis]
MSRSGRRTRPGRLRMRARSVCLALALAQPVLAQETQSSSPEQEVQKEQPAGGAAAVLDAVVVTGTADEEKKKAIGNTSGASKEDIERRNASHMSDLIDQVSGTSVNSLYSRPEVSVGVQGIAGHGRVAQSLEGINQNFHAFTRDIGQTGSIFIDPQFLRSIDVTRTGSTGTGALGSLGASVNFEYLDVDDILLPGKSFGGMVRGSTGFSKYGNGQKPSGSFFLGGRNERWDAMVGASRSKNDPYRIGDNISNDDLMHSMHGRNMDFRQSFDNRINVNEHGPCRYLANGYIGLANCGLTAQQAKWLKQAAKEPLKGTQRENESQMLRLRHYLQDPYNQSLELFVSSSKAKYQTDQQPAIYVPLDENSTPDDYWADGDASWFDQPWSVRAQLKSQVAALKWKGNFSELINPRVQIYHEKQDRKQNWTGASDGYGAHQPMHYFTDISSTGIKLSNDSHFDAGLLGPLRLDIGAEYRHARKRVDSLTESEYYEKWLQSTGRDIDVMRFDPDSRTKTAGLSLALSTAGDGPWQANASVGFQRVWLDVLNPVYGVGNISQAGVEYGTSYWRNHYRNLGYSGAELRELAAAATAESQARLRTDPSYGGTRTVREQQDHKFDLKSASLGLSYTPRGTGLTFYGQVGYSERAPTSNEMYMHGQIYRATFYANPHLRPEENLSFQLGMNYQNGNWLADNDRLAVGINLYRNRIYNQIIWGPFLVEGEPWSGVGNGSGSVNNLNDFIRQGIELNLAYKQPLFYVRSNLTLPIRHNNKTCSWQVPSGRAYLTGTTADGGISYTDIGKGERLCYSSWNWMETGIVEPIRGSLTAALTPYQGRLEMGGTVHFRGKQRSAYWYDRDVQNDYHLGQQAGQTQPIPDKSQFVDAYLWPKVVKFDLFVNYQFSDQLKAGIYLANVTNKMEATPTTWGYNFYPGRTLTANMEYRF